MFEIRSKEKFGSTNKVEGIVTVKSIAESSNTKTDRKN
jgi:hypothetical protein